MHAELPTSRQTTKVYHGNIVPICAMCTILHHCAVPLGCTSRRSLPDNSGLCGLLVSTIQNTAPQMQMHLTVLYYQLQGHKLTLLTCNVTVFVDFGVHKPERCIPEDASHSTFMLPTRPQADTPYLQCHDLHALWCPKARALRPGRCLHPSGSCPRP